MTGYTTFCLRPGGRISGRIRVPGDKSISHRAVMFGALAEGTTRVSGFLEGEDSLNTLRAFRAMGVKITDPEQGALTVEGVGLHGLSEPAEPLDLGNSGTSMRLMAGLLAAQSFPVTLTGDRSLSKRPMGRVTEPLALMGAEIGTAEGGRPPLRIPGGAQLKGIDYPLPMASAQVKSCVLLAGLYAEGETAVTEPAPTRDHTERMLRGFGYEVTSEGEPAAKRISLSGGGRLVAADIDVPADISSAAFFMVAASIAGEADLTLEHVGVNPTRTGVIEILKLMGADITLENPREVGGEPVADLRVRAARLKGIEIPEALVPLAIDEFPVLFVAAACAEGRTVLTGAEELRVKESDRIQVMAEGLQAIGARVEATPDGMIIDGLGGEPTCFDGGEVEAHDDHRIAMAFAVAALRSAADIRVNNCENVATSFPNFVELARRVGLSLEAI